MRELTVGKERNVTLNGVEGGFNALYNFPMEMNEVSIEFKIEKMLEMLNDCYKKTKDEIAGLFTMEECWFLIATFSGNLYGSRLNDKAVLLANVEDAMIYEDLDKICAIDGEKVLAKIEKLTEFQSFCVIRQAYEAHYLPGGERQAVLDNSCNDKIKRIFGIK